MFLVEIDRFVSQKIFQLAVAGFGGGMGGNIQLLPALSGGQKQIRPGKQRPVKLLPTDTPVFCHGRTLTSSTSAPSRMPVGEKPRLSYRRSAAVLLSWQVMATRELSPKGFAAM